MTIDQLEILFTMERVTNRNFDLFVNDFWTNFEHEGGII